MATPTIEELFDAAVGESSLNGEGLGQLYFYIVTGCDVEAAVDGFLALGAGVEEGQHRAAGVHDFGETGDNGNDESFGQVIERGPEKHGVEFPVAEAEAGVQEAADVVDGLAVLIFTLLPIALDGILDEVSHVDAVAEVGEEVDVGGRGVTDVKHAQARIGCKALAQCSPAAGVACHLGSGESANRLIRFVSFFEPAQHEFQNPMRLCR